MNLFGLLDVSGSALQAERIRAEVIAVNMANADTTRTASGGPYVRQQVVFKTASGNTSSGSFSDSFQSADEKAGVEIAAVVPDSAPAIKRFDPQHPDADKDGFVAYPDINPLTEMVDLIGASRSYGLNSSAVQSIKTMIVSSLDLLK
jgi:flagellar basal-body rod protein FlgC